MTILDQTISSHYCYETAASNVTEEYKAMCASDDEAGLVATAGTGCPSGATLSCTETNGSLSMTTHFYGDEYKDKTCADLEGAAE